MTLKHHTLIFSLITSSLIACNTDKEPINLSEKPEATRATNTETQPHLSRIGLRARINTDDFATLVRRELPETVNGDGTERTCRRVIGIKICGTAEWQYQINRSSDILVSAANDKIDLHIPLKFNGIAGIQGEVAEALNLSRLEFNGALDARLRFGLDLDENWCPIIDTKIEYTWTRKPKVNWSAGIKIDVQRYVDETIAKELQDLQPKLASAINCEKFRDSIQAQWRSHSFPLELTENETMHLNLTPSGFAFSGIRTEPDRLGVAFTLTASTSIESIAIDPIKVELPAVKRMEYDSAATEFEILIRAGYEQLRSLAAPSLEGKIFMSKTEAGPIAVKVKTLDISGNDQGITLAITFDADLPASSHNTPGTVYLTATPYIEQGTNLVTLRKIELTPVLDNKLWSLLATVFEKKIIFALREKAVLDLTPKIRDMENTLLTQLNDPARTAGLDIKADNVSISLERLTPEREALAAIVVAKMQLDIDVPLTALRPHR